MGVRSLPTIIAVDYQERGETDQARQTLATLLNLCKDADESLPTLTEILAFRSAGFTCALSSDRGEYGWIPALCRLAEIQSPGC
jgi:hypothetical protein